jgi:hypothetical protein
MIRARSTIHSPLQKGKMHFKTKCGLFVLDRTNPANQLPMPDRRSVAAPLPRRLCPRPAYTLAKDRTPEIRSVSSTELGGGHRLDLTRAILNSLTEDGL